MFKNCSKIKSLNLPRVAEIGENAFYACNKMDIIKIGRDSLGNIGTLAFKYTGSDPAILETKINKTNERLKNFAWADNSRRVDTEPPRGKVEIIAPKYPYTNTKDIHLKITLDAGVNSDDVEIAILNDKTYTIPTQEELDENGDTSLDIFNWQPYTSENKEWTLKDVEGARTVYVYFKDGAGNISNVLVDL
jgi:hypothetical protein